MRVLPLVASAALLLVGCDSATGSVSIPSRPAIEVASEFPLRGAIDYPQLDRAVGVAVAEHATIDGYRLVHITLDDSLGGAWNLDRAVQNMRRAVGESPILGVIGPWTSEQAGVLIPQTAPASLVVLSPSNTVDCLTDPVKRCLASETAPNSPRNYFRAAARDSLDAAASADFAVHKLGIARVAVLINPADVQFSQLMADAFSREIAQTGGKVVFTQNIFPQVPSFAPLLRDAYVAGAQAIYMPTGSDTACKLRKEMGGIFPADAYLISGDRLADDVCIQNAGLIGKTDDHFVLAIATGQPQAIPASLAGLTAGHGYPIYTFTAYDCARILIDAIDRAIRANYGKIPSRGQVLQAVASTTNFKGITGTYSFDANGDAINPGFSFYAVNQGSWTFWRTG